MQNPNENKKITEEKLENRTIEVLDNGKLQITEIHKIVYEQEYREFLTDVRKLQNFRKQIEETTEESFREKQFARIEELDKQIEELQPHLNASEKNFLKAQEDEKRDSVIQGIKSQISAKPADVNYTYVTNVAKYLIQEKINLSDYLDADALEKWTNLKVKAKRKQK